jgi:hypothetical protein
MDKIAAVRDRLATAPVRRSTIDQRGATPALTSLMKNGRCVGNRTDALRHFQPLHLFNSGML